MWQLRREGLAGLVLLGFVGFALGMIWWHGTPLDRTGYEHTTARLISAQYSITRYGPAKMALIAETRDGLQVSGSVRLDQADACRVGDTVSIDRKGFRIYLSDDPCRHR